MLLLNSSAPLPPRLEAQLRRIPDTPSEIIQKKISVRDCFDVFEHGYLRVLPAPNDTGGIFVEWVKTYKPMPTRGNLKLFLKKVAHNKLRDIFHREYEEPEGADDGCVRIPIFVVHRSDDMRAWRTKSHHSHYPDSHRFE
jgi:hypothetical protein